MKQADRMIFMCEICKKPKDPADGRILPRIVTKGSMDGPKTYRDYVAICYKCLPLGKDE